MADETKVVTADRLVADPDLAAAVRDRGFGSAGIRYDAGVLEELEAVFTEGMRRFSIALKETWIPTLALQDPVARAWFSDGIRAVATRALAGILDTDLALVWAGEFAIKPPGPGSLLGFHQGVSITDESRYQCLETWAALSPSTEANGAMRFVPGSQHLRNLPRLTMEPTSFTAVNDALAARETVVEAAPGEVLAFDSRIIHRTLPNCTEQPRIAARALIRPRPSTLRYYFRDASTPPGVAEVFEVNDRFCLDHGVYERPPQGSAEAIGTEAWQQLEGPELAAAVQELYPDAATVEPAAAAAGTERLPGATFFTSPIAQAHFDRHGFVVLPFLEPAELEALKQFVIDTKPSTGETFQSSQDVEEGTFRQTVSDGVIALMKRAVEATFNDPRFLLGALLLKPPGPKTEKSPHQDWTLVDERWSYSVAVWVPLVDTTEENGQLYLMPGSHRVWPTFRGQNLLQPFRHVPGEILATRLIPVPCRAGDAIVFDNRLVHWSPANQTDAVRPAAAVGLCPRDAVVVRYQQGDDGRLYRSFVEDRFYLEGNIYLDEPAGVLSTEAVSAVCPNFTIAQLPGRASPSVAERISG